jgi:hypothetical protein
MARGRAAAALLGGSGMEGWPTVALHWTARAGLPEKKDAAAARGRLGDELEDGSGTSGRSWTRGGVGDAPLDDDARGFALEKKDAAAVALLGSGTRADDGGEQRRARATSIWRSKTTCWLKYLREPLVPVCVVARD